MKVEARRVGIAGLKRIPPQVMATGVVAVLVYGSMDQKPKALLGLVMLIDFIVLRRGFSPPDFGP